MSAKLDRIGEERDKALRRRDEWDARYKELDLSLIHISRCWPWYLGRNQPSGRLWKRQSRCQISGVMNALHGQVIAVKDVYKRQCKEGESL